MAVGSRSAPGARTMELTEPTLLRERAFVDGAWVGARSGAAFEVCNPADSATIARVPDMDAGDARMAVNAAATALRAWRAKTAKERTHVLRAWMDLIRVHIDDLAHIMTAEQGKPLREARGEIGTGANVIEWFAEEARRIYGDIVPPTAADKRILVMRQPVGVVAAITPWNFPHGMIVRKCAPALAAGCTVVLKPAEETPLSALALAALAERAGFPAGVFNVVTARRPQAVGRELTANPTVRKLSFTGSTEVGKLLMRDCADTVKRLSLELGGNAPFIVFDDADLDAAIDGVVASKFRNAGQTCVCANRVFAHADIHEEFVARLVQAASGLVVGAGNEPDAEVGPLINADGLRKVERIVADAVAKGARIALGGARHARGGTFYQPTVLDEVRGDMACASEEIFGPVAPVFRFSTEEDVIAMANETRYGLAAYFYSRDLGRVFRSAEALEAGVIGVNVGISASEVAPFGGIKESGFGREGGRYGIDEYLEYKYMLVGGLDG